MEKRCICSFLRALCPHTGLSLLKTLPGFPPQSSCIPFSYWKETVSVLLGSDRTSLCAIASYIDEPFMDLDRDLLED